MRNLEATLKKAGIYYELYHHREIFSNEDALLVKSEQATFKKIRQLVGQRLKIIPANDMQQITGQKSGAFSPFSYDQSVSMIVVEELLS